jgi:hypothetical protein
METKHEKKSIDVVCSLGQQKAAIELKCFMKASNRAKDLDCYDTLIDIERLQNFSGFRIKKFICLTDNKYYSQTAQTGHGKPVSLKHGTVYTAGKKIIPGWAEKWKVKRDKPIILKKEIKCDWVTNKDWYFLKIDVS